MKNPMKPLAVAAATASLATIALATPASAKGNDPEVGGTMTFDRSSPACTQLEDAKTVGFYWWKNDPFVQKVMQNHKDNCTWLKAGVEYKVREIADAGFDTVFCLIGPENKDHCLWFLRPKGGDFYAPHKKKYQQAGRTWIEPGNVFSLNYAHLGCTDLLDAADAKWTEQTGVRMTRTNRPANSPAPDCKYLLPGVQFKVVQVDDEFRGEGLMGMSPAFRKLCLRPTTANENEACHWAIVFVD